MKTLLLPCLILVLTATSCTTTSGGQDKSMGTTGHFDIRDRLSASSEYSAKINSNMDRINLSIFLHGDMMYGDLFEAPFDQLALGLLPKLQLAIGEGLLRKSEYEIIKYRVGELAARCKSLPV